MLNRSLLLGLAALGFELALPMPDTALARASERSPTAIPAPGAIGLEAKIDASEAALRVEIQRQVYETRNALHTAIEGTRPEIKLFRQ